MEQELMELLQGVDEDTLRQYVELGVLDEEQAALAKQLQEANALRSLPTPEGRQVGRVYRAANPLEHLATAAKRMQGGSQAADVRAQQGVIPGKRVEGRLGFLRQFMQGQGQPEQESPVSAPFRF